MKYTINDVSFSLSSDELTIKVGENEQTIKWENDNLHRRYYIVEEPTDYLDYKAIVFEDGRKLFVAQNERGIYIADRTNAVFHLKQRIFLSWFSSKNLWFVGLWSKLSWNPKGYDNLY